MEPRINRPLASMPHCVPSSAAGGRDWICNEPAWSGFESFGRFKIQVPGSAYFLRLAGEAEGSSSRDSGRDAS